MSNATTTAVVVKKSGSVFNFFDATDKQFCDRILATAKRADAAAAALWNDIDNAIAAACVDAKARRTLSKLDLLMMTLEKTASGKAAAKVIKQYLPLFWNFDLKWSATGVARTTDIAGMQRFLNAPCPEQKFSDFKRGKDDEKKAKEKRAQTALENAAPEAALKPAVEKWLATINKLPEATLANKKIAQLRAAIVKFLN